MFTHSLSPSNSNPFNWLTFLSSKLIHFSFVSVFSPTPPTAFFLFLSSQEWKPSIKASGDYGSPCGFVASSFMGVPWAYWDSGVLGLAWPDA